jgi:hypothetical protein
MARQRGVPQKRIQFQPSSENKIPVTKFDAARRQLEIAVTLWFNDSDPVSVHTLTMAAHEILRVINKSRGGPAMCSEPSPHIREEYSDFYRELMLKSYNFFKHSTSDSAETYLFPPEVNQCLILDATEAYHRLTTDIRPLFKLFKWYMRTHESRLFLEPPRDWRPMNTWTKSQFFSELLPVAQSPDCMQAQIAKFQQMLQKFPSG